MAAAKPKPRRCGAQTVRCLNCQHHRKCHTDDGCQLTTECPKKGVVCPGPFAPKPCAKWPLEGKKRCKRHNGSALPGPANANWKGGRHSKFLPQALMERYEAGLDDPNLISLRAEVALVDARISSLLESLGDHGGSGVLRLIKARLEGFKAEAVKGKGTQESRAEALHKLESAIVTALTRATTWDELRDTLDLRRKLAESEGKRERDALQTISVQQAVVMMALLVKAVSEHVTDRNALNAIVTQFDRLTAGHGAPTQALLGRSDDTRMGAVRRAKK
jgi:hypothetical protein